MIFMLHANDTFANGCVLLTIMWNSPSRLQQQTTTEYVQVPSSMRFLGATDVLQRGFHVCQGLPSRNFNGQEEPTKNDIKLFKKHYGSDPAVLARIWHDMGETILLETGTTIIPESKDKTEKGFKSFLIATHFLWAYPKNGEMLASRFGVGLRQVQGENLWRWVRMIASLKEKKIVWPAEIYNDPTGQMYIVSVDGVDFKVWEMKHPMMPIDKGGYSHKFNHGALKYEIAIDVYTSKVVWISGPHKAGVHDKTIFMKGLQAKIPQGKKVVTDRVYGAKAEPNHHEKLALPNPCDNPLLANFKARVRSRHESFNGRIKCFRSLADTYHHDHKKHGHVFEAIAVTVQYQMDMGSKLFDA
jgi:hypothetical protein